MQKQLGSKVKTTFKELVPEGPQTCQVIESLVRDGNKIIFSTSFGFQNCMVSEAKKHPDVKFEQATGTAQSKNLAEYFGAGEDGIYLSGMAAGAATKKGVIGYVVPFAIPEVIRHANAFALGAQAVQIGTAFLACNESGTTDAHREMLFSERAQQTTLTRAFTGRLARGVRNRWTEEMRGVELPPFPVTSWFLSKLRPVAVAAGRTDLVSLWSGQIAPNLRHRSAAALMQSLTAAFEPKTFPQEEVIA